MSEDAPAPKRRGRPVGSKNKHKKKVDLSHLESSELKGAVVKVYSKDGQVTLSPGQVAHLRAKIASQVREQIELAHKVVLGEIEWSPTQARVFSTMLNKVVPDLSASFHQHEHRVAGIREMSRADLERIAAGLDDPSVVEAEYSLIPPSGDANEDPQP